MATSSRREIRWTSVNKAKLLSCIIDTKTLRPVNREFLGTPFDDSWTLELKGKDKVLVELRRDYSLDPTLATLSAEWNALRTNLKNHVIRNRSQWVDLKPGISDQFLLSWAAAAEGLWGFNDAFPCPRPMRILPPRANPFENRAVSTRINGTGVGSSSRPAAIGSGSGAAPLSGTAPQLTSASQEGTTCQNAILPTPAPRVHMHVLTPGPAPTALNRVSFWEIDRERLLGNYKPAKGSTFIVVSPPNAEPDFPETNLRIVGLIPTTAIPSNGGRFSLLRGREAVHLIANPFASFEDSPQDEDVNMLD